MGRDKLCFLGGKNMVFEREVAVLNNSEVVDVWGGRRSGVVNAEAKVVSGFGKGFGTDDDHALAKFSLRKLASIHNLISERKVRVE